MVLYVFCVFITLKCGLVMLFGRICMLVCLSVSLQCSNLTLTEKAHFGMQVYGENLQVKFLYQGHQVKIKVTGANSSWYCVSASDSQGGRRGFTMAQGLAPKSSATAVLKPLNSCVLGGWSGWFGSFGLCCLQGDDWKRSSTFCLPPIFFSRTAPAGWCVITDMFAGCLISTERESCI